jgi:hypothetical protein
MSFLDLGVDQAYFGFTIPFDSFGFLAAEHFERVLNTARLEDQGSRLIDDGFPEMDALEFVKDV